jgi:hypothetical protein
MSFILSILLATMNGILVYLLKLLSSCEGHKTNGSLVLSLATRLGAATFINTSVALLYIGYFVNYQFDGPGAFSQHLLLVSATNSLLLPTLKIIDISYFFKLF